MLTSDYVMEQTLNYYHIKFSLNICKTDRLTAIFVSTLISRLHLELSWFQMLFRCRFTSLIIISECPIQIYRVCPVGKKLRWFWAAVSLWDM